MEILLQDIRQGLRMLVRNKGFTAVAVIALALGIGPNTAIFSVVNELLLTPPPYEDPDTILRIRQTRRTPEGPREAAAISTDDFQDWRDMTRTLEHMAVYMGHTITLTGYEEPVRLNGASVSPALFPLLRVQPFMGEVFEAAHEKPGNDRVVLLSYSTWANRFGQDRSMVGKILKLDDNDYTVMGIMPRDFEFPNQESEYWVPLALTPPQRGGNQRRIMMIPGIVRLAEGVGVEQAEAEGQMIVQQLQQQDPGGDPQGRGATLRLVTLQEETIQEIRPALLILMVAVGLVLLIACANVANLLLTRSADRQREISIRAAIGAGQLRLVRQMLTESVILSLIGGALGLVLGYWAVMLLPRFSPDNLPRVDHIQIDLPVLGFTVGISVLTGLIFGLAPALKSARDDLAQSLKEGGIQAASGFQLFRRHKTRSLLTILEFALALMLLVAAGLLTNSFLQLISQSPGYDPTGVLTLQLNLPRARYSELNQHTAFYDQLLEEVRSLPGIQSAGITNMMPMSRAQIQLSFQIPGRPESSEPGSEPVCGLRLISPGFFQAMASPIVDGRDITDLDRESGVQVVIINESLARQYFAGERPIGRQIELMGAREIVGVVGDFKPQGLDSEPQPEMYLPYHQFGRMLMMQGPLSAMNVAARVQGDPLGLVQPIRTRVASIDPQLPIYNISTMDRRVSDSVAQPRFYAVLLGIFAGLALILAAVGIYGVLSYHVAQCTREIGIRMALGAQRSSVLNLVLRQGVVLAVIGIVFGLAGAWGASRFLASQLFGITPTDPATYVVIAVSMTVVALIAAYVPARRATAIDPVDALRYE